MGAQTARILAEDVKNGLSSLEQAVLIHMQSNCYPPYPRALLPVAIKAIKRYKADDETRIKLPDGILFQGSRFICPSDCVRSMHLLYFTGEEE